VIINLVILVISLGIMVGGAELLVRGAAAIARRFGMSSFFIGLTIVGFGTSTPELATSLSAAMNQLSDISMGNVVGSNIFNVAVILGIAALISPIPVNTRVVRSQAPIMLVVGALPFLVLFTGGVLTRGLGIAFVVGLIAFLWNSYRVDSPEGANEALIENELEEELGITESSIWTRPLVSVAAVLLGLVMLVVGSKLLVSSAVSIAQALGVSELVIALTIVAAGTSMPELATSVVAAFRKQADISIGNIVGSNIFNVLAIAGITSSIFPQTVSRQLLMMDMPLMLFLFVASVPIMFTGSRISRVEGGFFVLIYIAYLVVLFTLAPAWFN